MRAGSVSGSAGVTSVVGVPASSGSRVSSTTTGVSVAGSAAGSCVAGAALAMGNTLVVKPAEDASLTTIRIAQLALEAGVPEGVFNVIAGYGREAGAALSAHPLVDYVTFTGSPPTGTAIQQAAAVNNRGVTMELGGKSPQIVFADADIEAALPVLGAAATAWWGLRSPFFVATAMFVIGVLAVVVFMRDEPAVEASA